MKTIIEPFRIKTTEPITIISREERVRKLKAAHNNVFLLDAQDCCIDLLTDSGTGAMSTRQWAAMMMGDESYAGSNSWKKFQATVKQITGTRNVLPTHQGRAAESILTQTLIRKGNVIPNNSHFNTTRANIEHAGGIAVDLLCAEGTDTADQSPFKGNMDIGKLEQCIREHGSENIPFCMVTVTNNTGPHGIPLVMDACRYAENAYFIPEREEGYADTPLIEIAAEMFSYADAATMSCKKDGLANIGGFLICNDDAWAIAVGITEALEYDYQVYRHATVTYLGDKLTEMGVPIVQPAGGHAVFIDARKMLPHIPDLEYPGIGLVNALYIEGGVRGVEPGSVMFGSFDQDGREIPSPLELVRPAFPRRVYTQSHFEPVE